MADETNDFHADRQRVLAEAAARAEAAGAVGPAFDNSPAVEPPTGTCRYVTIYADAPACPECGEWDKRHTYRTVLHDEGRVQYVDCPACGNRYKISWLAPQVSD
jgi:DNA-directed RNA polymerase subunit M/transcription elongation factor TFIIS